MISMISLISIAIIINIDSFIVIVIITVIMSIVIICVCNSILLGYKHSPIEYDNEIETLVPRRSRPSAL